MRWAVLKPIECKLSTTLKACWESRRLATSWTPFTHQKRRSGPSSTSNASALTILRIKTRSRSTRWASAKNRRRLNLFKSPSSHSSLLYWWEALARVASPRVVTILGSAVEYSSPSKFRICQYSIRNRSRTEEPSSHSGNRCDKIKTCAQKMQAPCQISKFRWASLATKSESKCKRHC